MVLIMDHVGVPTDPNTGSKCSVLPGLWSPVSPKVLGEVCSFWQFRFSQTPRHISAHRGDAHGVWHMAMGSPVQAMSVQYLFYISVCPIQPERRKCSSVHENCESVTVASLKVDFRHQLNWIVRIGKIFTDISMNMFPQKVWYVG